MAKNIFKVNRSGIAGLMKSPEMQVILEEKATAIQKRCGEGYNHDLHIGKNRANAMVFAETFQAKKKITQKK